MDKNEWSLPVFSKFKCILLKKEVKKMSRPYFETKVVKVKKKEKDFKCKPRRYCRECWINKHCPIYKGTRKEESKPKGNWINGEDLDKIKFPCFCKYNGKYFGIIYIEKEETFGLINIDKQREKWCVESNGWHNLNNMINSYNIHILKGKIIIYEEATK